MTKEKKLPKSKKVNLEGLTYIEVYDLRLAHKIKQFPKYFWQEISEDDLRSLLRYFFEKVLEWNIEDIKSKADNYTFAKYKLSGLLQTFFAGSTFAAVDFTYPGEIKPWELSKTPMDYWTEETFLEAVHHILEKENWTETEIKTKSFARLIEKYGIYTPFQDLFQYNSYRVINILYPGKFKEWELTHTSANFWNKETAIDAVRWIIEEKLQWTTEQIKQNLNQDTFKQFNLLGTINTFFNCSAFKAIDAAYPCRFTQRDFQRVPKDYWTRKKAIEAIQELLKNKTDTEIKEEITLQFLNDNGLSRPLVKFFHNRIYDVLDAAYPGRFSPLEIKNRRTRSQRQYSATKKKPI